MHVEDRGEQVVITMARGLSWTACRICHSVVGVNCRDVIARANTKPRQACPGEAFPWGGGGSLRHRQRMGAAQSGGSSRSSFSASNARESGISCWDCCMIG